MTAPTLTAEALLAKIAEMREANATNSEIAHACGYTKPNGNPAFVDFYSAMIEAKFPNGLPVEDEVEFEEGSLAAKLSETYPTEAIQAFIDYWSEDDLEFFGDAYVGEYRSDAEFAREMTEDLYGPIDNLPPFVEIDWEATWQNLRYDFIELNGYFFSQNW